MEASQWWKIMVIFSFRIVAAKFEKKNVISITTGEKHSLVWLVVL